eukprot:gene36707-48780_t
MAVLGAVFACGMNEEFDNTTNLFFLAFGAGILIVVAMGNFFNIVLSSKQGWSPQKYAA